MLNLSKYSTEQKRRGGDYMRVYPRDVDLGASVTSESSWMISVTSSYSYSLKVMLRAGG